MRWRASACSGSVRHVAHVDLRKRQPSELGPSLVGICVAELSATSSVGGPRAHSSRYLLPRIKLATNGRCSLPGSALIGFLCFSR